MIEVLALTKAGVPFDIACDLDDIERSAWIIAAGIATGGEYDWHSRKWKKPDA